MMCGELQPYLADYYLVSLSFGYDSVELKVCMAAMDIRTESLPQQVPRTSMKSGIVRCRAADVTADVYTVCYSLGRKAFDELLGPIEDVWRFEALRKVPVLFALSEQQLFELARCMKNHSISAGQMVFRQGDPGGLPANCQLDPMRHA